MSLLKRKKADALLTSIVFIGVILIGLVLAFLILSSAQNGDFCTKPLKYISLEEQSCFDGVFTTFYITISSKEVDSFTVELIDAVGAKKLVIKDSKSYADVRMIYSDFGKPLTTKKGTNGYVVKGNYAIIDLSSELNGKSCSISDSVTLLHCQEPFLQPEKKLVLLSEKIFKKKIHRGGGGGGSDPVCGNGILESEEQCDDGNTINGDGCSSSCLLEPTFSLTLISPSDGQIFDTLTIPLEFTITGIADSCWYKLDNTQNVPIPNCQNTFFDTTEGPHSIEIFANFTTGDLLTDNANFTVDLNALIISDVTTNPQLPFTTNQPTDIEVNLTSNRFPIGVTFSLFDQNNIIVHSQNTIQINTQDELPVTYNFPGNLPDGTYTLKMEIMDTSNNIVIIDLGDITMQTLATCNGAGEDQLIFKLVTETNAHAETWDSPNYNKEVCYNNIFEINYSGNNPHQCTGNNKVLGLSSETNAHAEIPSMSNYGVNVCYGNLVCEARTSCLQNEKEIVALSSETNAHLELPGINNYDVKVCCSLQ